MSYKSTLIDRGTVDAQRRLKEANDTFLKSFKDHVTQAPCEVVQEINAAEAMPTVPN
jgi:hypothetical protein